MVFDKTGTLTLGEPALAHSEMGHRRHPRARGQAFGREPPSLCARWARVAEAAGLRIAPITHVREVAGFGLERAGPDGVERLALARCGRRRTWGNGEAAAGWHRARGRRHVGSQFEDQLRSEAAETSLRCTRRASTVKLLSGDRETAIETVAIHSGIGHWTARRLPAQKIAGVEALKQPAARR